MKTAEDKKEPCVTSGIVFGTTDTASILNDISKTGAVLDVADGTLKFCEHASVDDLFSISIELPDNVVSSIVEQEQLDNIGLEISISSLDEDTTNVYTQLTTASGRVETDIPLETGRYELSAKIGYEHLEGSPKKVLVLPASPEFDGIRCGNLLSISNENRSLTSISDYKSWSSACTTRMVTCTGSSILMVRIDRTLFGDIVLSACSSSN
eukprot:scpid111298/ scgid7161/ 